MECLAKYTIINISLFYIINELVTRLKLVKRMFEHTQLSC